MKLGDVATQLSVDPRKLTEYALNPNHLAGGANKARRFRERLWYTRDNYEPLLRQICKQALSAEAVATERDRHGQRYRVDLDIVGANGRRAIVRTGWAIAPGSTVARLATLYVRK